MQQSRVRSRLQFPLSTSECLSLVLLSTHAYSLFLTTASKFQHGVLELLIVRGGAKGEGIFGLVIVVVGEGELVDGMCRLSNGMGGRERTYLCLC
jgi:hypothetical protein